MTERNPLSRFDIINWAVCPVCRSPQGEPCIYRSGNVRAHSHYERMQVAQRNVKASLPSRQIEWRVLWIGLAALVVAAVLGIVFGDVVLNYVIDQFISPPFTPTQLETL